MFSLLFKFYENCSHSLLKRTNFLAKDFRKVKESLTQRKFNPKKVRNNVEEKSKSSQIKVEMVSKKLTFQKKNYVFTNYGGGKYYVFSLIEVFKKKLLTHA